MLSIPFAMYYSAQNHRAAHSALAPLSYILTRSNGYAALLRTNVLCRVDPLLDVRLAAAAAYVMRHYDKICNKRIVTKPISPEPGSSLFDAAPQR